MVGRKRKTILSTLTILVTLFFFYLPILLMIVFSFNSSKSLSVWSGFSLKWYLNLFNDREIVEEIGRAHV